jgi:uncharacterized membrane protein YfcA
MNALVGGGSFVTLPALVGAGLSGLQANASSSVALYPGGALSAFVYRGGLRSVSNVPVSPLIAVSILGGIGGALLLLWTPTRVFDRILPWLLLTATLVLAFGPRLVRMQATSTSTSTITGTTTGTAAAGARHGQRALLAVQFLLGVYGGYFGGAVGLLMIAVWRVLGEHDIKALNGPRTLLVTASNTAAIALLIAAGVVKWAACLPVGAGALAGGYLGARVGKRLSPRVVRVMTLVISISITFAFFVKAYGPR